MRLSLANGSDLTTLAISCWMLLILSSPHDAFRVPILLSGFRGMPEEVNEYVTYKYMTSGVLEVERSDPLHAPCVVWPLASQTPTATLLQPPIIRAPGAWHPSSVFFLS